MTYKFDKEKLNLMLKDFYTITNVTMSVWDGDFNQLTFYPKPMAPICEKIKSDPEGKKRCLDSDITACTKARDMGGAFTFTCHAGLVDTVVPIYHNDDLIAYIMFGQIRDKEETLSSIDKVKSLCKKYGVDEKTIEKYYDGLPILNRGQIDAIANLFTMCVPYFYTSQAIRIEQNELAAEIDTYISKNITSVLSIRELCDEFQITVSMLYQISHKFFKTPIKDYIIGKRIEKAKHYLATTRLSISEISVKTGFSDYNYFIRTFRIRVGCTPLSYRKNFPLNVL